MVPGGGVLVAVAVAVGWWFSLPGRNEVDVVVVGDVAVEQARPEIERRLRQAGLVPEVVIVVGGTCAATLAELSVGDAEVVLSFATSSSWTDCGRVESAVGVQQPGGADGSAAVGAWRAAAPLFTGEDREACAWWDTPGPGEWKDGLGECEVDGRVTVTDDDGLTLAGRERFARLIVAAVG